MLRWTRKGIILSWNSKLISKKYLRTLVKTISDHYISRSLSVSSSAYYYSLLHYLIVGIYVIFLHSDDDEPCIGLCYYKKILEEEQNKMERDQVLYHHLDSRAQSLEDPRDTPYMFLKPLSSHRHLPRKMTCPALLSILQFLRPPVLKECTLLLWDRNFFKIEADLERFFAFSRSQTCFFLG